MATPIASSLTDHSPLDNTGAAILGSQVDENPNTLAAVLDGTTGTTLNSAASPLMNFTATPYTLDNKSIKIRILNGEAGTINAGELVYFSSYDSTTGLYNVKKAVSTLVSSTTFYAQAVVDSTTILTTAQGSVCTTRMLTAQNTDTIAVGSRVYLNTTAGGWTTTIPAAEYRIQVVGTVVEMSATTGRILFQLPGSIIPWSIADQI